MGLLFVLHVILISIASTAQLSHAWGKEGHFMVCKIAEQYLTEKTARSVLELLPEVAEGELANVCSWPDQVRFQYPWSSLLHYANTPGVCTYMGKRDCHDSKGVNGRCVVGAINNYTNQLQTYGDSSNGYNLTESLMFLAHFMGDVHQPLHVGFEADEGGNTIMVRWYRTMSNLHHVWDVSIIETAMRDFYDNNLTSMLKAIQTNILDGWSDEVEYWEKCRKKRATCANKYASESTRLSCNYAYKGVEQNSTLGDDYFFTRLPIVEKRIAQGGIRLAMQLNRIFDADEEIFSYKKQAISIGSI